MPSAIERRVQACCPPMADAPSAAGTADEVLRQKLQRLRLTGLPSVESDCTAPATPTTAAPLTPTSAATLPNACKNKSKAEEPACSPLDYSLLSQAEPAEVMEAVKPHSSEAKDDAGMRCLLSQIRNLSQECFKEDCLEHCSKRGGWRLTLLIARIRDGEASEVPTLLLGFIVYKHKPEMGVFSVAKIAVPGELRRHGFGRQLMSWALQTAKKDPQIGCISLSSLPQAVTFYQRLGFKRLHEITAKDENALFPGQVYMEQKIRRNKKGPRGRR